MLGLLLFSGQSILFDLKIVIQNRIGHVCRETRHGHIVHMRVPCSRHAISADLARSLNQSVHVGRA